MVPAIALRSILESDVMAMPLDGLTLRPTTMELNEKLLHARIMKIYQPNPYTILLHFRQPGSNFRLVLSIDPNYPRIHLTDWQPENPVNPPGFCMLMRKYLEPSRVLEIRQHGLERVVFLELETFDSAGQRTKKTLVFELLGRQSNLLLLDDRHIVMDALRRPNPEGNDRLFHPGDRYVLPPDQGKTNPLDLDVSDFLEVFRFLPLDLPIERGIGQLFQGFSRQSAREAARRSGFDPHSAKGDLNPGQWENVWQGITSIVQEAREGKHAYCWENDRLEFSAYHQDLPNGQSFASVNAMLDFVFTDRVDQQKVQQRARVLTKQLQTHQKRLQRKEQKQADALAEAKELDRWKQFGELITANLYQISKGDEAKVVDFYDPDQKFITIPMDPQKTPNENAQAYFKRYNKAKTTLSITGRELVKTRREKEYIDSLLTQIELADTLVLLEEIRDEMEKAGYLRKQRKKKDPRRPGGQQSPDEYISSDGFSILVGRNNHQNDTLTFRISKPDDVWLHAQKIPGSHVIIRDGDRAPDSTLLEAAVLAARYSKARTSPKVPVDYTQRKHVRKPNGAPPGFVIYDTFKTMLTNPTSTDPLPEKRPSTSGRKTE